jgi:uncharacterized protein (DUF1330 family)
MAAYVIVNITVRDPVRYEEYKRLATPTIPAYGGRYVARGGRVDVREGAWSPSRLVILEFPSRLQQLGAVEERVERREDRGVVAHRSLLSVRCRAATRFRIARASARASVTRLSE